MMKNRLPAKLKLLAIVGPTAVGKSELALLVAERLQGEIISCDSMQIYRGLDIGTGKVTDVRRSRLPHHLLDRVEVGDDYSVAQYAAEAKILIQAINSRGKLPILVGGTGLYYQAVVDDYDFYPMQKKQEIRTKWEHIIKEKGTDFAYEELLHVDPDYAAVISEHDRKRIIRALEVFELTGQPFSQQQNRKDQPYDLLAVGLCMERSILYEQIDRRIDRMMADGLLQEATAFIKKGHDLNSNAMQALGYKQIWYYWHGFLTYEDMMTTIKKETHRYAKRQMTWFKKDMRIKWLPVLKSDTAECLFEKFSYIWEGQKKAT